MTNLWTYWEGSKPEWIDICLKSIEKSCSSNCKFYLVTPENLRDFIVIKNIPDNYFLLKNAAHRADYVRAYLLSRYGGFYYDADTIGLRCPTILLSETKSYTKDVLYTKWDRKDSAIINGYIYCKAGSALANDWFNEVHTILSEIDLNKGIGWTALGEKVLTKLMTDVDNFGNKRPYSKELVPLNTFMPVEVDKCPYKLMSNTNPGSWIKENTICFGLNNSWLTANFGDLLYTPSNMWHKIPRLLFRLLLKTKDNLSKGCNSC